MKKWNGLLISAALAVLVTGTARAGTAPRDRNQDLKSAATGINRFAFDLYRELGKKKQGKNMFLSPTSISTALAMTYAGARGMTARQMARVLHYTLPQNRMHSAYGRLIGSLNRRTRKSGNKLTVANALWAQRGLRILPGYLGLVSRKYRGGLRKMDFARVPEQCRRRINRWVEKKTNNKIKNLLKRGVISSSTRLVLTNAIYFKGQWASEFDKKNTRNAPFKRISGGPVTVPMMHQYTRFKYGASRGHQMLVLPYKGKKLSMVVLLPARNTLLAALEKSLSEKWLTRQIARTYKRKVKVFLPRFKTTAEFMLGRPLKALGMKRAFTDAADFSGITGGRDLKISAVIHKAFVHVNEEGTEAAAATAIVMRPTSVSRNPVFRADRPFLFLIRDNTTGTILFMGRIHDPTK